MLLEQPAGLPGPFTLYLARHAAPDRTRFDLPYHIPPGPNLTEKGLREAAELGEFLCGAGVVHFLASPLERAWRTATIAAETCGATLELNQDLTEWRPEENESTVLARVQQAFETGLSLAMAKGGPVALVTHGGPILAALRWLGAPAETLERMRIYDNRNPLPTAGAWRIERLDGGELHAQLAFAPAGVMIPTERSF
mgnify:CR=1 FL=1